MELNTGWDGTSDTSWYTDSENTYYISYADQLAGLRDLCNAGNTFEGKTIVLNKDIDLSGLEWTPMGSYDYNGTKAFRGTLDGAGHTISGLNASGKNYVGFIGCAYNAEIKNLTLEGSVSGVNYVGGFAGYITGTSFTDCVNNVSVTSTGYQVGGFAGVSSALSKTKTSAFTRCVNNGAITSTDTAHTGTNSYAVGGIIGCISGANVPVSYCKNTGAITASTQSVGGVVGAVSFASGSGSPRVEYCFNTGTVSNGCTNGYTGGVVGNIYGGYAKTSVLGCLNLGSVVCTADDSAGYVGGVIGYNTSSYTSVSRSFYYYATASLGLGNKEDVEDQVEAFGSESDNGYAEVVEELDEAFMLSGGNIILKWENTSATYIVQLSVSYDTSLNRTSGDKPVFTVRSDSEEFAVTSGGRAELPSGIYYYIASQNGYDVAKGSFVVDGKDTAVSIKLYALRYDLEVTCVPADAAVTVTNVNGTEQKAVSSENGVWHFSLYNGTYSYTVSAYGFDPKSGSVTVRYEDTKLDVALEGLKSYNTSFVLKPVSGSFTTAPVLSIFQDNALVEKLTGAESSAVLAAGNYRYVARASGFSTTTGEFTVSGESTVEITMALPGGGAVADTEWYYLDPDAGRFEIGSADELYGLAQLVNEGADDFSGKTLVLTADINMSSIAWTPIGSWSGLHFKGEFDGAGHSIVITNGTISGNEVCFGLFGYLDGANVHDLTLRGNINVAHSSDSDSSVIVYVGSLAGFAANSTISRVSSQLNVTVKAVVGSSGVLDVGGLIGWANGDTLDSCSNLGGITTEISTLGLGSNKVCLAYGGGLIGYGMSMTPGLSVTNCYNTGAVSCTAPSFAKAGGIVGVLAGSSSFIMRNCYNAGTMTVSGSSQSAAAALLNESKGTLANNYYLDSSAPSTVGIAKTADELRSAEAVEDLGGAYTYVEGRFPKLAWEKTAGTIAIGSMPDKLSYTDLEDFDETGMTLVVSYEDGTSETITSGWTVVNGKGLRVDMGGKSDSSTAEVMIDIEYRGLVLRVPVTVKQTVHLIDNSELKLSIPAPKAGAKAEPITIETDKYTATVTWMQAGEEFDGTFEKDTFYRANVSIKAKYETGSIWYGFENSSVMSVDGVLEILYKSVKSVAADNGDKTLMTAELTFPATGERKAAFNEKALHLYYEGDSNADYSVDRLLGMKLTITAEGKSVSYTLRELEQRMLAGECVESTYSRYDGVSRTSAKLTGISLYTLCAESGLFAMNLSDSSLITIGGAEYTWGQIRATGSAYDAEGKLTAQGLPTVISVASDGTPYTAARGPMQAARPMASADDVSFPSWTKTDSVVLTGAEYLDTHSVTFVVTNDTGAVISGPDITVTDVYGNVIPAENGVYMLNDGQNYSYRVSARGYGARVGETGAVTRDAVITVSLFECWDGVTLTEPEIDDNGYYLIYTAEELMWFNRNATGTESVKLMADITLNSDDEFVNVWNTMNTSETRTGYFSGIFDGNGHTIHNLYIQLENLYTIILDNDGTPLLLSSRQDNAAMFGYLSGIVRDLGVTGRIEVLDRPDSQYATWMQIGGIAGYMTGGATISGCYTDIDIVYDVGKETTVTGGYPDCGFPEYCDVYAGGIVGSISKGTVTNCYSTGSISVVGTRKTSVGGIVGGLRGANAAVEYCYSTGSITAIPTENSDSGFISGAGGIVGDGAAYSAGDGGSVMYCFALGDSINCGTSDKVKANCVVGSVNDTNVIKYNYSNTAMNVIGGIHDDTSFSRNSVNGAQIDLARAKASLTPYTNIGWSNAIWKSDDAYSLPTFYWQRSGGRTDIYSVSVVSDTAAAVFTGGVAGTEGAYTTTGSSTISFTVKADKYKTADVVTVTGGKLTSANGYYTVSGITGDVVITITTKWLYGDVNGDGAVNAIDAMLALRASVGAVELSAEQKIVADVDGNGSVNSTDAVTILRYGIGMLTELPINK